MSIAMDVAPSKNAIDAIDADTMDNALDAAVSVQNAQEITREDLSLPSDGASVVEKFPACMRNI